MMLKPSICRMSLTEYETTDHDSIREAYREELRLGRIPFDNNHIQISNVEIWDEEKETTYRLKPCFYNQYGFFYKYEDEGSINISSTNVRRFVHWTASVYTDAPTYTIVASNVAPLVFKSKEDVKPYLDFCKEYNDYIDDLILEAMESADKHYLTLSAKPEIQTASMNLLSMLNDQLLVSFNLHSLLLQMLTLNYDANPIMKEYYSFQDEIIQESIKLINDNETCLTIYQDALDKIIGFSNILHESYDVPISCNRLVVCWLIQDAARKLYHDKWIQEYDKNCKIVDLNEYVSACVNSSILTQDDGYGMMLLSWAVDDSFKEGKSRIMDIYPVVEKAVNAISESMKKESFKNRLFSNHTSTVTVRKKTTIDDIDLMTGVEFEQFIADLFKKQGYQTSITKGSGDQGIDVIIEKEAIRIGIQAKCYGSSVGNTAVQEAVAGKAFYNLDRIMVITNNFFSSSAVQLAKANNVVLWDRNILKEKLSSNDD